MTSENLKNPSVPVLANPVDLDAAIQLIQLGLADKLTWLEKSFGRARTHPSTVVDDKKRPEPKVYQGKSEYYPVLPNDALKSYSFFRTMGSREFNDYFPNTSVISQYTKVDLIIWGNLKAIDATRDGYFSEELLNETTKALSTFSSVIIKKVWDDKPEDIFKGYHLEPNHLHLLMHPYFAFRIEMHIDYILNCTP